MYAASYFQNLGPANSARVDCPLTLGLPLIVVTSTLFMPVGAQILKSKAVDERMLILAAASFGLLGIHFSLILAQTFSQFTVLFALSFGMVNGLCYTIPLKVGWDYFPDNKGMVTGIIVFGFGLGTFIFGFLSTMLINPNNLSGKE